MIIDAKGLDFSVLNDTIRNTDDTHCQIINCMGQRFIGAGAQDKTIEIIGTPGNALGAYLNGADIVVHANAQDAVGDTMNSGKVIVHGNIGDATGYAMRGGEIYVKGNAGYRAGIHMKEYGNKKPVIVIGGRTGSFLGEYQAGGLIIVLGLNDDGEEIISNFPCTGMHGGKMFLRGDKTSLHFPSQVNTHLASDEEKAEIAEYIENFVRLFGGDSSSLLSDTYTVIVPDSKNPYKQMYVAN